MNGMVIIDHEDILFIVGSSISKHLLLGIFYGEREREVAKWPILREQLSWVWHKDMQVIDTLAIKEDSNLFIKKKKEDSNLQATHPH